MYIKDRETKLGTVYERYSSKDDLIQKVAAIGFVQEATRSGQTYFIITSISAHPFYEANYYLNVIMGEAGYRKRERAFNALKLLFAYIQLFNIDFRKNFTKENSSELKLFLKGGYQAGNLLSLQLKRARSKNTRNSYFSVYKDFYKIMFPSQDAEIFNVKRDSGNVNNNSSHNQKQKIDAFLITGRVPKYIKEHEYEWIMGIINKKHTLREKIIIELMYSYGLRIGEVLGLTVEDFEIDGTVVIRNRATDQPDQSAKNLIIPKSIEEFNTNRDLKKYGIGFTTVSIDSDLLELIDEYIDETRGPITLSKSPKKKKNIETRAKADKIGTVRLNGENTCLFLNKRDCTPLTQGGWNYVLRGVFEEVGLHLDKDVKDNNLSHRFRHGFAMYHVKRGVEIIELQKLLRHGDPRSCAIYYNPDDDEKLALREKIEQKRRQDYDFGD